MSPMLKTFLREIGAATSALTSPRVGRFLTKWGKQYRSDSTIPMPSREDASLTSSIGYAAEYDKIIGQWNTSASRKEVHMLMIRMCYEEDGIVAAARDASVEAAIGTEAYESDGEDDAPPFRVVITKAPRGVRTESAEAYLHEAFLSSGMYTQAPRIISNTWVHGNDFREVVMTVPRSPGRKPQFVEAKEIDEWKMWPKRHPTKGHRMQGYHYNDGVQNYDLDEHEIVHFARAIDQYGLGIPAMYEERRNWKRLAANEDAVAVDRYYRAHPRYSFTVPVPHESNPAATMAALASFKKFQVLSHIYDTSRSVADIATSPTQPLSDIYLPIYYAMDPMNDNKLVTYGGQVTPLEFNSGQLSSLTDMEYSQEKIRSRTGVPPRFMGLEHDRTGALTESGLEREDMNWARKIRALQRAFKGDRRHGMRKLVNILLMYEYGSFSDFEFRIDMAKVNLDDERDKAAIRAVQVNTLATIAKLPPGEVPMEWIFKNIWEMTDKQWNEFKSQQASERKEYGIDPKMYFAGREYLPEPSPGKNGAIKGIGNNGKVDKKRAPELATQMMLAQGDPHPMTEGVFAATVGQTLAGTVLRSNLGEKGSKDSKVSARSSLIRRRKYERKRSREGEITPTRPRGPDGGDGAGGLRTS